VDAVAEGKLQLITSRQLLEELERVLAYRRLAPVLQQTGLSASELADAVARAANVVRPTSTLMVARDDADNRVLEAAVSGAAEVIVSGDDDLLSLGTIEGIEIMSAADAVVRLGLSREAG